MDLHRHGKPSGSTGRMLLILALMALLALGCICPALGARGTTRLSDTPDRAAALALMAALEQAGIRTQGLSLYVLPVEGEARSMAVAVLDAEEGFRFPSSGEQDALTGLMAQLGASETAQALGIDRVAIQYRDQEGRAVLTLTASSDALARFAQGELSREAFMEAVEGRIDLGAVAGEVLE